MMNRATLKRTFSNPAKVFHHFLVVSVAIASLCLAACSTTIGTTKSATTVVPIANAGFAQASADNATQPDGWNKVPPAAQTTIDKAVKWHGNSSVLITRPTEVPFAGISQSIPSLAWRGKILVLRAKLKSEEITMGNNGLWLRGDGDGRVGLQFASTYGQPLRGNTDWVTRQLVIQVADKADMLVFGATMASEGKLWVDAVELVEFSPSENPAMEPAAKTYLEDAISEVRAVALKADTVDWTQITRLAYALSDGAAVPADTHDAVRLVLRSLNDGHSFLMPPSEAKEIARNKAVDDFKIASTNLAGIGYVSVPGYTGDQQSRRTAFANEMQHRIATVQAAGPCGWILDLRGNTGGNMYPMLAGLTPLLGDGILGSFVSPKYSRAWYIRDGRAGSEGESIAAARPLAALSGGTGSIAVLTGPMTASSGEAVAISFTGRPNTRSFGQSTRGASTANSTVRLSDSAVMAITTATMADRNGKRYGGKIEPDEAVATGLKGVALADDPVVKAAIAWLDQQSGCRK